MTGEQPRSGEGRATRDGRAYVTDGPVDEDLLSTVLGSTSAGLLAVDGDTIFFANHAIERYVERGPDELVGTDISREFPDPFVDRINQVATGAGDRRPIDVDVAFSPEPERTEGVSVTLESVPGTERVVATFTGAGERGGPELSSTGLSPEVRVESDGDTAVVDLDTEGRVVTWGREARALTGWTDGEVLGTHVLGLSSDDSGDGDVPEDVCERARRDGKYEYEGVLSRSDGSDLWVVSTVTPLRTNDGDLAGFRMVLRDRTERKRLEDERELLADVSRVVADAETFQGGVEQALAAVCDRTQWAYGEAWMPATDGEDPELEQVVAHAGDPALEPFLTASRSVTFSFGDGLPGRVWESESPEWIPDASAEPQTAFHRTDLAESVGLKAALGVPIVTDERAVAVLTFFLRERRHTDDRLVDVVTDVAADLGGLMARAATRESLERERSLLGQIFETSPVGLLVTDTDRIVVRANRQAGAMFRRSDSEITGSEFEALATFETPSGSRLATDELPVARALETGQAVTDVELEVGRPDGETVWASVSAAPIRANGGTVERVAVVVENVTDRKERERSLRAFEEAVDQAGHSIYFTDVDGVIQYVNPTFERTTGYSAEEAVGKTPAILSSGEHDEVFFEELWETILDGEVWTGEVVNERASGDRYVVNQTIAPIVDDTGEIDRFVAVNDEITEQKRRERTLRRQRNSLERIKQIMESLRPINRDLARAGTREDIDQLVCERLAASDAYLFAWVGEYNRATGTVTPREWAGVEAEFVRNLDIVESGNGDGNGDRDGEDDIFERAVTEREVQTLQGVPASAVETDCRDRAPTDGYQSQAAVPVVYGDTLLGVIGVYSDRPDAFDEYEQGLLRELGERVGHATNAAENKQLLQTDTVVELEFDVGQDASSVAGVAAECDCRLSLNDVTPTSGTDQVTYLEVDGADPEAVAETFDQCEDVTTARVVKAHGETGVVEVTGRLGPVATLFEHGATVRSFEATTDNATLVGETAPQSDVEPVIKDVASHDDAVFVAKRTRDREVRTLALTEALVEEALTGRQREAVALAYHAGYFASPRDSTGEELADALGVSSPTFYRHVREGVRKILELVVDGDTSSTPRST